MSDRPTAPGVVHYERDRWWRVSEEGLQDLIVPRKHDENMWENGGLVNEAQGIINEHICAQQGCTLCLSMIAERAGWQRDPYTQHTRTEAWPWKLGTVVWCDRNKRFERVHEHVINDSFATLQVNTEEL